MMTSRRVEDHGDGRTRVVLSAFERCLLGIVATVIVGAIGTSTVWVVASVQSMLIEQGKTITKLDDINKQLVDVPTLKTEVTRMQDKIEQHEQDIRELKQFRRLKP